MKQGSRWAPILALAVWAGGCSRPQPPAATHLAIGQLTSATTLDPHLQDDERTYSTLDHFYDKLVGFGPEMQIVPELAVRWENLSDTEWRFHLRRGVVFHDGRPFGAEDVKTSIRRAQTLAGSMVSYYVQSIREVRVIDDLTVALLTRDPSPVLLNKLVFIAIVPRDTAEAPITNPVGTGPYRFVGGAPGQTIEGRRFRRFWGPRPEFDRVRIVSLPDARERARAVLDGQVDAVGRFPEEFWEWASGQKTMRLVSRQGISEVLLGFSVKPGSPFADPRVREAVALSVDRKEIAVSGLKGLAAPLDQLVPPSVFGYSSRLSPMPFDPARARRLLAEAGVGGGFETPILVPDYLRGIADVLQKRLAALGIRLKPDVRPFSEFNRKWRGEDVPMTLFGWGAATGDASDFLDALLHSPENGYGRSNRFGYANPEMDRLIELSDRTLDPAARQESITNAQEILRRDLPFIPLVLRYDLYALRRNLVWTPRPDRKVRAFDFKLAQPAG
ncbi:MAG TPA: ABC transporter substrate-binding protein [Thermoanaerobaculia bacterium]|nr:ABC transporter substrate-binding protein [Thermoanaerobaculia bacterium]